MVSVLFALHGVFLHTKKPQHILSGARFAARLPCCHWQSRQNCDKTGDVLDDRNKTGEVGDKCCGKTLPHRTVVLWTMPKIMLFIVAIEWLTIL